MANQRTQEGLVRIAPLVNDSNRKETEAKIIAVLKSPDASGFDKDVACRQAATVGSKDSVPALAAIVVGDDHLCDVACWGLERIPDAEAGEALRAALGKVKGRQLQKVIQTIANRRDQEAVAPLAELVGNSDAEVAATAARALGKIGGREAGAAIGQALQNGPAPVKLAAAQASLAMAETLMASDRGDIAVKVCERVRAAQLPAYMRAAATRMAILAQKAEGVPLLLQQLEGNEKEAFNVALRTIREMPAEAAKALEGKVDALPADKRELVTLALKDRRA
jgi:HEAT repeat protein